MPKQKTKTGSHWLEYTPVTTPQCILRGFEAQEEECVTCILSGIPDEGGSATKRNFEMIVRMAFQGGLVAATNRPSEVSSPINPPSETTRAHQRASEALLKSKISNRLVSELSETTCAHRAAIEAELLELYRLHFAEVKLLVEGLKKVGAYPLGTFAAAISMQDIAYETLAEAQKTYGTWTRTEYADLESQISNFKSVHPTG